MNPNPRILHVNFSDNNGGAARAAYRIHQEVKNLGMDSSFLVFKKETDMVDVIQYGSTLFRLKHKLKLRLLRFFLNLLVHRARPITCSPQIFSSGLLDYINKSDFDIVHLHWFQGEMLSIKDVGRINKKIVWTIHDMWAFSGAEHLSPNQRYIYGYSIESRLKGDGGFDIDAWTWRRKLKYWKKKDMVLVAPSMWVYSAIKNSEIFRDRYVARIQHPIDCNFWARMADSQIINKRQNQNPVKFVMLNATSSSDDFYKGLDLLDKVLIRLSKISQPYKIGLIVLGCKTQRPAYAHFPLIHFFGHVADDERLREIYSVADVFITTSRFESFGLMVQEAISCSTPSVVFSGSGVSELIHHKVNGYIARKYSIEDFCNGVAYLLTRTIVRKSFATQSSFDEALTVSPAKQYRDIYRLIA